MIQTATATAKDLAVVKDLDLKCYPYPLENDAWTFVFVDSTCVVHIVYVYNKPVGFQILEPIESNLRVWRLGVLRKFNGRGAGKALLARADEFRAAIKAPVLDTVVPEIHCLPGDPDDVSVWLKFQGFKATKVKKDYFDMYGRKYDGFVFERGT